MGSFSLAKEYTIYHTYYTIPYYMPTIYAFYTVWREKRERKKKLIIKKEMRKVLGFLCYGSITLPETDIWGSKI